MKILVVDDNRDFAETLADILRINGHDADSAYSGEAAVSLFEKAKYDLAFIDVKLPGRNGVEFFLDIRKKVSDCRFVLMTGYKVNELLNFAVENGAVGVLEKPFDAEEVLDIIRNVRKGSNDDKKSPRLIYKSGKKK